MTTLDAVMRKKNPVEASAEELAALELVRMVEECRSDAVELVWT